MQLTIDIKESAMDKVMYLLNNLKPDVKIIDNNSLNIEVVSKDDKDFKYIENGRKERIIDSKNYGTLNDINWDWFMYKIIPHKRVIKFINSRNPKDKKRIKEKFELLQQNPFPINTTIDSKKLQNRDGFRLRIGGYRFIYDILDDELIIYMEYADSRGDIY